MNRNLRKKRVVSLSLSYLHVINNSRYVHNPMKLLNSLILLGGRVCLIALILSLLLKSLHLIFLYQRTSIYLLEKYICVYLTSTQTI